MANLPRQPLEINPDGRPHLSVSALTAYIDCELAYRFARVDRVKTPDSVRFVVGTAAHEVAEASTKMALETGAHMPADDAVAMFERRFVEEWSSKEVTPDVLREFGTPERARDALYLAGVRSVRTFLAEVAPALGRIISVEREVRIPLNAPFDLVARLDLVREDELGRRIVSDYKFTKSATRLNADEWIGADVYALADAFTNGGRMPDLIELIKIQRQAKGARVIRDETTRDARRVIAFVEDTVVPIAERIASDQFEPTGLGTWKCGYCAFADRCEPFQSQSTITAPAPERIDSV